MHEDQFSCSRQPGISSAKRVDPLQLLPFILILSSHLRPYLPFKFPDNNFACISHFSHAHYMHSQTHYPEFINLIIFSKAKLVRRGQCIGSWWGNRRERDHWGDLGVDGWIILGWISRRWDVGMWTGMGWSRIETGGVRL